MPHAACCLLHAQRKRCSSLMQYALLIRALYAHLNASLYFCYPPPLPLYLPLLIRVSAASPVPCHSSPTMSPSSSPTMSPDEPCASGPSSASAGLTRPPTPASQPGPRSTDPGPVRRRSPGESESGGPGSEYRARVGESESGGPGHTADTDGGRATRGQRVAAD